MLLRNYERVLVTDGIGVSRNLFVLSGKPCIGSSMIKHPRCMDLLYIRVDRRIAGYAASHSEVDKNLNSMGGR